MMKSLILLLLPFVAFAQWVPEQENPGLFEGDIVLSPDQKQAIQQGNYGYATIKYNLWPKNGDYVEVPFAFKSGLPSQSKSAVYKAAQDYAKYTCIKLQEWKGEGAYIEFYNGGGCSSPVGRTGGRNSISLPKGCLRHGTVLHEIAHSLGVYHEQSRPDRDNHVSIQWSSISTRAQHNFKKRTYSEVDSLGTPYDFRSIMHYGKTAFGGGRVTIVTKDPNMQNVIGQRSAFSQIDIIQLNKLYGCNGGGPRPTNQPTQAPDCRDRVVDCYKYLKHCKSNYDAWRKYMASSCRKSCRFC